ncbi:MAG: hypothetical protein WBG30_04070, partial [Psychrilyobacter sp.]
MINLIKRSLTINETKLEKLLNSLINKGRYNILTTLIELNKLDKEVKNGLINYIFEIENNELKNLENDSYQLKEIISKLYLNIETDEKENILDILSEKLEKIENVSLFYRFSSESKKIPKILPEIADTLMKIMNKIIFKNDKLTKYSIKKIEKLNKEDILENYLGYLVNDDINNIKFLKKENLKILLSSFWVSAIYNNIKKSEKKDEIISKIKEKDILKEIENNYYGFIIADLLGNKIFKEKFKKEFKKENNVYPSLPDDLTWHEKEKLEYNEILNEVLKKDLETNILIEKIDKVIKLEISDGIEKIYFEYKKKILKDIEKINVSFIEKISKYLKGDESFELLKVISEKSYEKYEYRRYYGLVSNILKEYKNDKQEKIQEKNLEETYNVLQLVMKDENDVNISEGGIGIGMLYQYIDIIFQTLYYENRSIEERAKLFWNKITKWKEKFPKIINLFLGENLEVLEWFYLNFEKNIIKENWEIVINNKTREFYIGFCHLNRVSKDFLKSLNKSGFFVEWI